jgi:hypothetical protein
LLEGLRIEEPKYPIEGVVGWNARQLVQSKDDMMRLARTALHRTQKLPKLAKSFFLQPECQYAGI